jgi:hypothetical protein
MAAPYQALIPTATGEANASLSRLATIDFEALSVHQRYDEIEKLAAALVPAEHLSEVQRSMFLDKEFREDFEKFAEGIYRSYDRKFLMREFARFAIREEGHFAECGVFKGASAYILAKELKNAGSGKKLHLFDSFEGLSAPAAIDGEHWTKGTCWGVSIRFKTTCRKWRPISSITKVGFPKVSTKTPKTSFLLYILMWIYTSQRSTLSRIFIRGCRGMA